MNPIFDAVSNLNRVQQTWTGVMKDAAQKQSSQLARLMGEDIEDQRETIRSVSQEAIAQLRNPETMFTSVVSIPLFLIKLQTLWLQQSVESMLSIQQKLGVETKQAVHHWQEQNSRLMKKALQSQPTLPIHERPAKETRRSNSGMHHRGFPGA
nr:hypothetical protein NCPCFENI_00257 [Cupriavidus sp.]